MSMIGNFLQLTTDQLAEAISEPAQIDSLLDREADEPTGIEVDKAWHAIHFLLTNSPWEGDAPLANAVLGGIEIGEDGGYGPAKYITAAEVQEVASRLPTREVLQQSYDASALTANEIYPDIWDDESTREYVLEYYELMRDYYLDAAAQGNAMLKYLN